MSVQKATLGTGSRRPGPGPSLSGIVFQCGEANVLRLEGCKLELVSCRFNILSFQKATLGTGSRRPGPLTPHTKGGLPRGRRHGTYSFYPGAGHAARVLAGGLRWQPKVI